MATDNRVMEPSAAALGPRAPSRQVRVCTPPLSYGLGMALRPVRPALIIIAVVIFAAVVRLSSLGYDSLAHDEAFRANWWHHGDIGQARRFPPLQYALGWAVQHIVGRSEFVLRLPYALAGIACVVVLYRFARKHLDPWAAVLIAALAAGHPVLVQCSQRAKVFSLEALMAAVLMWAGLEAYRKPSGRRLLLFLGAGLLGLGLTFTSSLVIASWIPLLAWASLRGKETNRRQVGMFLCVAGILVAAGTAWYVWLAGCADREVYARYYDTTEVGWPTSTAAGTPVGITDLVKWIPAATFGAFRYVLGITHCWPPLNWCIATVEVLALAASLGVLWKRCRPLCVATLLLGAGTILAGALHLWPFGNLRHTTFLIPIVITAIGCGLWELTRRLGRSPPAALLLILCILVPAARATKRTIVSPAVSEHTRPVFEYVSAHHRPGDAMFAYYFVRHALEFYWSDTEMPVLLQPGNDRGNMPAFTERFDEWIKQHRRVWFVFTHNWRNEREEWIGHLKETYTLIDEFRTADASAHLFALEGA